MKKNNANNNIIMIGNSIKVAKSNGTTEKNRSNSWNGMQGEKLN
jgi:hypothetical protein